MERDLETLREERECAICKDDMHTLAFSVLDLELPDTVHRLSCHHAFHSSCLLTFFRSNSKTACPLCRNGSQDHYTITTRQGNNLTFTVTDNDVEEEEEEYDPWATMALALRPYRSASPIRRARKELKALTTAYNTLKNELKRKKKQYIQKALHKFRAQYRVRYREAQMGYKEAAQKVFQLEKQGFINDKGEDAYATQGWKDIHTLLGSGAGIQEEFGDSRKSDPWNSSFWYA
jgi:hypothetical protein